MTIVFVVSVLSATPQNWGKRPRYIDRIDERTPDKKKIGPERCLGYGKAKFGPNVHIKFGRCYERTYNYTIKSSNGVHLTDS